MSNRRPIKRQRASTHAIEDDIETIFLMLQTKLEVLQQLVSVFSADNDPIIQQQLELTRSQVRDEIKGMIMMGIDLTDLFSRFGADILRASIYDSQATIKRVQKDRDQIIDMVNEDLLLQQRLVEQERRRDAYAQQASRLFIKDRGQMFDQRYDELPPAADRHMASYEGGGDDRFSDLDMLDFLERIGSYDGIPRRQGPLSEGPGPSRHQSFHSFRATSEERKSIANVAGQQDTPIADTEEEVQASLAHASSRITSSMMMPETQLALHPEEEVKHEIIKTAEVLTKQRNKDLKISLMQDINDDRIDKAIGDLESSIANYILAQSKILSAKDVARMNPENTFDVLTALSDKIGDQEMIVKLANLGKLRRGTNNAVLYQRFLTELKTKKKTEPQISPAGQIDP